MKSIDSGEWFNVSHPKESLDVANKEYRVWKKNTYKITKLRIIDSDGVVQEIPCTTSK